MGLRLDLYLNKNNGIFNLQSWQTVMDVEIGEINSQGWIWLVAKGVTDILFVLAFPSNFLKGIFVLNAWKYSSFWAHEA